MPKTATRYYNWEGDACRVHLLENGDQKADIYRAGKGILPTDFTDVIRASREIGPAEYEELVDEENARHERQKDASPKPKLTLVKR